MFYLSLQSYVFFFSYEYKKWCMSFFFFTFALSNRLNVILIFKIIHLFIIVYYDF